jgi:hypothetical protein
MVFCKRELLFLLMALLGAFVSAPAQVTGTGQRAIEVVRFKVNPNVRFPDTSVDQLMRDLVDQLTGLKMFSNVTLASSSDPSAKHDLVLMGVITKYERPKAARIATYGIAGNDYLTATFKIVDTATDKDILQKQVKAAGITGLLSGNWDSVERNLSRFIAKHVKKLKN